MKGERVSHCTASYSSRQMSRHGRYMIVEQDHGESQSLPTLSNSFVWMLKGPPGETLPGVAGERGLPGLQVIHTIHTAM